MNTGLGLRVITRGASTDEKGSEVEERMSLVVGVGVGMADLSVCVCCERGVGAGGGYLRGTCW